MYRFLQEPNRSALNPVLYVNNLSIDLNITVCEIYLFQSFSSYSKYMHPSIECTACRATVIAHLKSSHVYLRANFS
jgi:hypothetical protein